MRSSDFVEASSYIRIMEKRLLSAESVNRAADASGDLEALKLLSQNSGYDFSSLKKTEDYEFVLRDGLIEAYNLLYNLSKRREVVDITAAKYDYHSIKVCLKAKHTGKNADELLFSVSGLNFADVESYIKKGENRNELPEHIADAIDHAESEFDKSGDPQAIALSVDKSMFAYMSLLADKTENDFIKEYVALSIDFFNIKTLMRVKNMQKGSAFLRECLVDGGVTDVKLFLENYDKSPEALASVFFYKHFGEIVQKGIEDYGRSGNFAKLEKLFDDCLIEYTRKSKYIAFGPEVLLAYIVSRENEIRQIRILVTCKKYGVATETLRERLRENYV